MGSSVPTCPKSAQQAFVLGLRRGRSCILLLPRDPFQGYFLACHGLAHSPSRGTTMAMQSTRSSRSGQRRILDLPKDLLAEVLALLPFYLKAQAQTICWIFNNILSSPDMGQLLPVILQSTVIIPLLHGHPLAPIYASVQPCRYPALRTGISAGASCCNHSPPTAISSITSNHSCCCCCCCCCCSCWGCTASCTSSTCRTDELLEEARNV
jgi:hypothetical protein